MTDNHFSVVVIGGGPAGSSAATTLAKAGIDVLVVEQELFPRFHIGESLLPNCNNFLKKLGVWEKVEKSNFVIKRGGQFMSPNKSHLVVNIFSHGLVKGMDMTYQVERAKFDELLLNHAQDSGSVVWQEHKVNHAQRTRTGWLIEVTDKHQKKIQVNTQWIVDASGRKCVMGRQLKFKRESLPIPGRLAIFNHFKQVHRNRCERGGDTLVIRLQHAWVWFIPLSNGITSVGVVLQSGDEQLKNKSLKDIFWQKINESSVAIELMKDAESREEYKADSDYSYAYESYGVDRVLLAGDAGSFIDPVFSSGICLALESGILAADLIQNALKNPQIEQQLYSRYTAKLKQNMKKMRQLIEMFYDMRGADILLTPRPILKIPQAVNAVLAGVLNPGWNVRWRLWVFDKIYLRHKKSPLVPVINWEEASNATKTNEMAN